ncbi:AbrB/MazE/SpoVT family DNA-binding domain-containing protein [Candidatus Acetothermia bacterium]|nr:AbrB/MazE/SpoVT family DNA-binding domain-containing protein [Candidatus Acetothermia bacterium]
MATVKILRNGQITLPAKLRKVMNLEKGDQLELDFRDDEITLRPAVVFSREEAKKKLAELINKARDHNRDTDPQKIEKEVARAVAAIRRKKRGKA